MSLLVDIRKLQLFNQMAKTGANTVADHLRKMTGLETEMEITKINFVDIEDIDAHLGQERQVGAFIELTEPPHGHVLILFSERSAKRLATALLGDGQEVATDGGEFNDMEQSAVQEVCNVMTSGFIDGWANVLETSIDISTPEFVHQTGTDIVDDVVAPRDTEMALFFDSRIHAPAADVEAKVYTFPELAELVELMNQISV